MKFQLKALAVAVLASVSGLASAAIDNGGTGNGELFLLAYDTTSQTTYSFDTGLLEQAFTASSAAAESYSLTGFSSFLAGATASTVRWGVYADAVAAKDSLFTTGVAAGATAATPSASKINASVTFLQSFANDANTRGTHATSANGWALQSVAPASGTDFSYGGNILGPNGDFSANLKFATTGALTDTLNFYKFGNGGSLSSTRTVFANTWKLDSATNTLTYGTVAAVPEPGTYALMLAGLMTLGAVARRRSK